MDGPRAVKPEELPSLGKLVDTVFRLGREGTMFWQFSQLLNEDNAKNLFVFVEDGKVVSHFGMTERWASIEGWAARVACVGSVATYEEYRGKGLATKLFEKCKRKAMVDGVDFMLISGGRGLYRRAGAVDYGTDYVVRVDLDNAKSLSKMDVKVAGCEGASLFHCSDVYQNKVVRFVRPMMDWERFNTALHSMFGDAHFAVVEKEDKFKGYLVFSRPNEEGLSCVTEFAGDEETLASAIKPLMDKYEITCLEFHLQPQDEIFLELLEGLPVEKRPNVGTLLVLNFPQLMERFTPYCRDKMGSRRTGKLLFRENADRFIFSVGGEEFVVEDRAKLGQVLFGDGVEIPEPWNQVFPIPSLWYGLNYV